MSETVLNKWCKILPIVVQPLVSTCASLGKFGWSSGPLGLWTIEVSASVHWIERASRFAQPCPTSSQNPLPPAQYPRRAFKCSLKRGNAKGEGEIRACSSRRSIAWHYPPAIPSTPLSCSLLCSWCVSLNLFLSFSFIPQSLTDFFPSSSGILLMLQLHKRTNKPPSEKEQ